MDTYVVGRILAMKSLLIALVLCTVAASSAFGQDTADTKPATGAQQPTDPKAVAKKILEAMKSGDMDAMLDCFDLKAMYDSDIPHLGHKPGVEDLSFEQWEKAFREQTSREAGDIRKPDLEYKILGTAEEEGTTWVTFKILEGKESNWEEIEMPFKKVDGEWKCYMEEARPRKRQREVVEKEVEAVKQQEKAFQEGPVSQEVRCDKCDETSPFKVAFKTRGKFQTCPKCGEKAARAIVYFVCGDPDCNNQLIKFANHVFEGSKFHKSPDRLVCPKCGRPEFILPQVLHLDAAKEIAKKTGQDFP